MKQVTLVKLFVRGQDEALEFYATKLGFEVAEDNKLGGYRNLPVRHITHQHVHERILRLAGRWRAALPAGELLALQPVLREPVRALVEDAARVGFRPARGHRGPAPVTVTAGLSGGRWPVG